MKSEPIVELDVRRGRDPRRLQRLTQLLLKLLDAPGTPEEGRRS